MAETVCAENESELESENCQKNCEVERMSWSDAMIAKAMNLSKMAEIESRSVFDVGRVQPRNQIVKIWRCRSKRIQKWNPRHRSSCVYD